MYKLLLCWRYLRTRYIALICIVSVTLGVATMIVVNSVMAGFTAKMKSEMNSMLGDLTVQVNSLDGVPDAPGHMARIKQALRDQVVGMSPMIAVYAQLYMQVGGGSSTRGVMLIGIDEATYATVSGLGKLLQHPSNRERLSFQLHDGGYDTADHDVQDPAAVADRPELGFAGWPYRKALAEHRQAQREAYQRAHAADAAAPGAATEIADPFAQRQASAGQEAGPAGRDFDPAVEQHTGIVLALSECSSRYPDGSTHLYNRPGDDLRVVMPTASLPPDVLSDNYTIVDVYTDPMRVDNASMAFVPLAHLQKIRGMIDPTIGAERGGRFTSIQIKLQPGADATAARDKLRTLFDGMHYSVTTWQDNQAMLLHAIQTETTVLNILLFFIVAVAGFGILAIFYMIVVEKTRDIGILKSLGASSLGIMGIFLTYGLSLGLVGAGAGTVLGLTFSAHINEVADLLERVQGAPVFDPSVYFFDRIPTVIDPWTIAWITAGSVAIAVVASVMPALRAAKLHPVRALRFE
ncbi:MAG TPA: FtsX-like permease family protein [Lacipirellulaceae bacterium]|nr:FtsX-like permease family protein [Lacipirellulaceae bacterium]